MSREGEVAGLLLACPPSRIIALPAGQAPGRGKDRVWADRQAGIRKADARATDCSVPDQAINGINRGSGTTHPLPERDTPSCSSVSKLLQNAPR